jgi:hypothetical protein
VKAGKACCTVEYDSATVDFLTRNLWLEEREACDRTAIGKALTAMVADAARR